MDKPRQVFFNSDERGITLLSVAVYTLLKTNDPAKPVAVYVVHDDGFQAAGGVERIRGIVERYAFASVWFGNFSPILAQYADVFSEGKTKMLWAFPLCDKILPPSVRGNIVYIDIDMLIRTDLGFLFDLPLAQKRLVAAAVNESKRSDRQYLVEALWPETAGYSFNNATTVLNLDAFRDEHMSDQIIAWYARHKHHAPDLDQDAQNVIYGDRTLRIPIKWNYTDGWLERIVKMNPFAQKWRVFPPRSVLEAALDPCIIHYIGRRKPTQWTHRPERKAFRKALEELGLCTGDLPGETFPRKVIALFFDAFHALIRLYARALLPFMLELPDAQPAGRAHDRG